jgi:3-methyladenine DNA glycosylase AlkD
VKFGDMSNIIRRIGRDSSLAWELWANGAFEARHIACKVVEPADFSEADIDRWVAEIDMPLLSDVLAELVYGTPYADKKRREWIAEDDEFVHRAGFRWCIWVPWSARFMIPPTRPRR